ncbi:elicitor protein [Ophiocordyceps sinensis CO18]|uniref:Elicitor protein n=1 Tax=Ophiocordyceps sinensis (strain Co18 / CGMCC 3.14243) TaxID=911162 RepID=T5AGP8_OPHSC|nr:elicitor protein [Ophiocordyceps sinensis CO18]
MSNVQSQNRFAYLGTAPPSLCARRLDAPLGRLHNPPIGELPNGNDDDGEEKPVVPVKTIDKAASRTTKRNAEPQAPEAPALGSGGNRRGGPRGNEGAFRDRGAGSDRNHGRSTEEAPSDGPRSGYGARVRGGRGSRRPREFDDRHPSRAGGHGGSDKQAAQSWGATEGDAELKDEQAGDAIAQSEHKEALAEALP